MFACWVVDGSSWCSSPTQESLIMKSSTGNAVMVCLNLRSLHSQKSTHFVAKLSDLSVFPFSGRGQPAVGAPAPGGAQRPVSYL